MIKNATLVAAAIAVWCISAAPARADLLSLRAQAQVGGAGGAGIGGARSDNAFHDGASGVAYGAILGAEVLFIDAWVEHNQYSNGGGLVGTWTQFMLGVDLSFDIGDKSRGGSYDDEGKRVGGGYSTLYGEVALGFGYGVGTGQQVDPPLDKSEVTDKGFLAQLSFGVGYRLSELLSFGVTVPVQAGYMFKSGQGVAANDESNHYRSVQGAVLGFFRVDLELQ